MKSPPYLDPRAMWWRVGDYRFRRKHLIGYRLRDRKLIFILRCGHVQTVHTNSPADGESVVELLDQALGILTENERES